MLKIICFVLLLIIVTNIITHYVHSDRFFYTKLVVQDKIDEIKWYKEFMQRYPEKKKLVKRFDRYGYGNLILTMKDNSKYFYRSRDNSLTKIDPLRKMDSYIYD